MDNDLPCRENLVEVYKYLTGQDQTGQRSKLAGSKLLDGGKGIHAGLWLDKYIGKQVREDTASRRDLVEQVSRIPISDAYQQFYRRWEEVIRREYGAQVQYGTVKGRMAVGLGDEGVLETSVKLHRTYGVPYIPGSALKGLAAHYANLRAPQGSGWKKGEEQYNVVFGQMEGEGNVIFFDAFYMPPDKDSAERPLHPDIITVHHREYYQDQQKAPADWDSPTPIPFLSATGTYLLALAAPELPQSEQWIGGVFTILGQALEEMGIGAKTSSGYGRMTLKSADKNRTTGQTSTQVEHVDPDKQKAERLIREISRLTPNGIAGQLPNYYQQWQKLTSVLHRRNLAQTIIDKVRQMNKEKDFAEKKWYRELRAFLESFSVEK